MWGLVPLSGSYINVGERITFHVDVTVHRLLYGLVRASDVDGGSSFISIIIVCNIYESVI